MNEIWKNIPETEERYQASNFGRIKSLLTNKILKTVKYKYEQVGLFINGKQVTFLVHRLVWSAFNGKIPEGMEINHINENKFDNRLENLSLVSHTDNINWGTRTKRASISKTNGKKSRKVAQYDLKGNLIKIWPSRMEIQRALKYNNALICQCCLGNTESAYGYLWKNA